jgi:N-acyl-L-homoserine lactone synthetase
VAADVSQADPFKGLTFTVATDDERPEALSFRGEIYRDELGDSGIDGFDDSAHHLLARDAAGLIVAALRIVGPEQRPFDLEQLFDLSTVLPLDRVPAEVSRFCIAKKHRQIHRNHMVHMGMLKLVHEFSVKTGITDLFTLGLPHLKNLYRVGYFSPLGIICDHPIWGRTELMRLDIDDARRRYETAPSRIATLLFRTRIPNVIV